MNIMRILSHRGYWKSLEEQNTIKAFERSFSLGFGTETDVRDFNGELVISHDIPNAGMNNIILLEEFFKLYNTIDSSLPLALNIKSDGLFFKLKELLHNYHIQNYFVFDMSVPDLIGYVKSGLNVFTRQSEFEKEPSLLNECHGVWLDEFNSNWISNDIIFDYVSSGKKICIVSPELHQRSYTKEWGNYKEIVNQKYSENVMICTDFPETAKRYFDN